MILDSSRDTVEEFWDKNILDSFRNNNTSVSEHEFMEAMSRFLSTEGSMWVLPNARTALFYLLRAISSARPGRKYVLLCSFNCPVVASAIIKAGLKAETFDFHTKNGKIDWIDVAAKITSRHAGLIVSHFFGVPYDFRPVLNAARRNESFVIEDCAHTLGGRIGDRMAGTLGDAAIFSFNYDKPISLGGGGLLLINNAELQPDIEKTPSRNSFDYEYNELMKFIKFLEVRRNDITKQNLVRKISTRIKSKLGLPGYTFSFPRSIGPLRVALGLWQLQKYPEIIRIRNKHAEIISQKCQSNSWHVDTAVMPAWLRQKVLPNDDKKSKELATQLQRLGLRVGPFNWRKTVETTLGMIEKPNAKYVATYGLDIPVHQNMKPREVAFIADLLTE